MFSGAGKFQRKFSIRETVLTKPCSFAVSKNFRFRDNAKGNTLASARHPVSSQKCGTDESDCHVTEQSPPKRYRYK